MHLHGMTTAIKRIVRLSGSDDPPSCAHPRPRVSRDARKHELARDDQCRLLDVALTFLMGGHQTARASCMQTLTGGRGTGRAGDPARTPVASRLPRIR